MLSAFVQVTAGAEEQASTLVMVLSAGFWLFLIAGFFLVRSAMIKRMKSLMAAASDSAGNAILPGLQADEVEARNRPRFVEAGAERVPGRAVELRERCIKNARALLRQSFYTDVAAGFGYALLPALAGLAATLRED